MLILALSLPCCVTVHNWPDLTVPQFPHMEVGFIQKLPQAPPVSKEAPQKDTLLPGSIAEDLTAEDQVPRLQPFSATLDQNRSWLT